MKYQMIYIFKQLHIKNKLNVKNMKDKLQNLFAWILYVMSQIINFALNVKMNHL